jgi:hypothetical protein
MSDQEDEMPDAIAVTVRFNGDPDDLFDRFERARRLWIESQQTTMRVQSSMPPARRTTES